MLPYISEKHIHKVFFTPDHLALFNQLKSNGAAMMRTGVGRSVGSIHLADSLGVETAHSGTMSAFVGSERLVASLS